MWYFQTKIYGEQGETAKLSWSDLAMQDNQPKFLQVVKRPDTNCTYVNTYCKMNLGFCVDFAKLLNQQWNKIQLFSVNSI